MMRTMHREHQIDTEILQQKAYLLEGMEIDECIEKKHFLDNFNEQLQKVS